jgi:serine/threonine protein kinase/tetratricopeptide (TPR) repeat protein
MTLIRGIRIGEYEIVRSIGSGGMGEVYRAKDHKLERDVALKVLKEEGASDPDRLERFEKEARAASALNHPNIVTIHDIGMHRSAPFVVMELLEGRTLRETLSDGPLATEKVLELATQTADGLAKAHSAGIVHRDLKPENLMVTEDGFVKILDFGLAKLLPDPAPLESEAPTAAKWETAPGVVMGTVGYMSPEQAGGRDVDHRSDQFAFGLILYEMVTGNRAFERDTAAQTLAAIIDEEPEPISEINPEVPERLQAIVKRCLAKDPKGRYDSTGDLAKDLKTALEPAPVRSPARRRIAVAAAVAAILVIALGLNFERLRDLFLGASPSHPIESLAVLPLENLSGDPEQEYFVDGMTDELIAQLAQIRALKVISRTSVIQYKGAKRPLPEIARELDVDAIVEGTVRRSEGRVRITAQLIEASTDRHLWARSYERDLNDILSLQNEVAGAIVEEIQVNLTSQEEKRLAPRPQLDAAAYEAYLRGRYHLNRRTEADFWKAIDYFEHATGIAPNYAPAYAGIADAFLLLNTYGSVSLSAALPRAKEAASRALEINEETAEAHTSLAYAKYKEWDWPGSERSFKRAIELNPGYVQAHHWYGVLLSTLRRHDEAIAETRRALELDPLSLPVNRALGQRLLEARRYDESIEVVTKALEMDPRFLPALYTLAVAYLQNGMHDEAIETFETHREYSGDVTGGGLGYAYAVAGRREDALRIAQQIRELGKTKYIAPTNIAVIYMALGDKDEALRLLEAEIENRTGGWPQTLNQQPCWDPLRSDPRFQDLLRRMNLPE